MRKMDQQRSRNHANRRRLAAARGTVKKNPDDKIRVSQDHYPMHEAFTLYMAWLDAKLLGQFKAHPKKVKKSTYYHGAISKANRSSRALLNHEFTMGLRT